MNPSEESRGENTNSDSAPNSSNLSPLLASQSSPIEMGEILETNSGMNILNQDDQVIVNNTSEAMQIEENVSSSSVSSTMASNDNNQSHINITNSSNLSTANENATRGGSLMSISVKTIDNRIHKISVPRDTFIPNTEKDGDSSNLTTGDNIPNSSSLLISELKQQIEVVTCIPADRQRLIFRGKVLVENQPISFYKILNGQAIHCIARPPNANHPPTSENSSSSSNPTSSSNNNTNTGNNDPSSGGTPFGLAAGLMNLIESVLTQPPSNRNNSDGGVNDRSQNNNNAENDPFVSLGLPGLNLGGNRRMQANTRIHVIDRRNGNGSTQDPNAPQGPQFASPISVPITRGMPNAGLGMSFLPPHFGGLGGGLGNGLGLTISTRAPRGAVILNDALQPGSLEHLRQGLMTMHSILPMMNMSETSDYNDNTIERRRRRRSLTMGSRRSVDNNRKTYNEEENYQWSKINTDVKLKDQPLDLKMETEKIDLDNEENIMELDKEQRHFPPSSSIKMKADDDDDDDDEEDDDRDLSDLEAEMQEIQNRWEDLLRITEKKRKDKGGHHPYKLKSDERSKIFQKTSSGTMNSGIKKLSTESQKGIEKRFPMQAQRNFLTSSDIKNNKVKSSKKRCPKFFIGQWVDVKDTVNQWLEATILDIKEEEDHDEDKKMDDDDHDDDASDSKNNIKREGQVVQKVYVHYNGWPQRWDEWIRADSPRIAPFRTRTLYNPSSNSHHAHAAFFHSQESMTRDGRLNLENISPLTNLNNSHLSTAPIFANPIPDAGVVNAPNTGEDDTRLFLPELLRMYNLLSPYLNELSALSIRELEIDSRRRIRENRNQQKEGKESFENPIYERSQTNDVNSNEVRESTDDLGTLLEPLLSQDRPQNQGRRQRNGNTPILNTAVPRNERPYGVYMNEPNTSATANSSRSQKGNNNFLPWVLPQSMSSLTEKMSEEGINETTFLNSDFFSLRNNSEEVYREDGFDFDTPNHHLNYNSKKRKEPYVGSGKSKRRRKSGNCDLNVEDEKVDEDDFSEDQQDMKYVALSDKQDYGQLGLDMEKYSTNEQDENEQYCKIFNKISTLSNDLAPLLDRFGRVLVDTAPHLARLGQDVAFQQSANDSTQDEVVPKTDISLSGVDEKDEKNNVVSDHLSTNEEENSKSVTGTLSGENKRGRTRTREVLQRHAGTLRPPLPISSSRGRSNNSIESNSANGNDTSDSSNSYNIPPLPQQLRSRTPSPSTAYRSLVALPSPYPHPHLYYISSHGNSRESSTTNSSNANIRTTNASNDTSITTHNRINEQPSTTTLPLVGRMDNGLSDNDSMQRKSNSDNQSPKNEENTKGGRKDRKQVDGMVENIDLDKDSDEEEEDEEEESTQEIVGEQMQKKDPDSHDQDKDQEGSEKSSSGVKGSKQSYNENKSKNMQSSTSRQSNTNGNETQSSSKKKSGIDTANNPTITGVSTDTTTNPTVTGPSNTQRQTGRHTITIRLPANTSVNNGPRGHSFSVIHSRGPTERHNNVQGSNPNSAQNSVTNNGPLGANNINTQNQQRNIGRPVTQFVIRGRNVPHVLHQRVNPMSSADGDQFFSRPSASTVLPPPPGATRIVLQRRTVGQPPFSSRQQQESQQQPTQQPPSVSPASSSTSNSKDREQMEAQQSSNMASKKQGNQNGNESEVSVPDSSKNDAFLQRTVDDGGIPLPVGALSPPVASSVESSIRSGTVNTNKKTPGPSSQSTGEQRNISVEEMDGNTNAETENRDGRGNGIFNRILQRFSYRK